MSGSRPQVDAALVARMAWLARVHLTPDEAIGMQHDLERILGHVDELRTLETAGVVPMLHAGDRAMPLRADTVLPSLGTAQALANAPAAAAGSFTVPRVVG